MVAAPAGSIATSWYVTGRAEDSMANTSTIAGEVVQKTQIEQGLMCGYIWVRYHDSVIRIPSPESRTTKKEEEVTTRNFRG